MVVVVVVVVIVIVVVVVSVVVLVVGLVTVFVVIVEILVFLLAHKETNCTPLGWQRRVAESTCNGNATNLPEAWMRQYMFGQKR